jgi:hypothetical protein
MGSGVTIHMSYYKVEKVSHLNAKRMIILSRIKGNPGIWSFYYTDKSELREVKRFRVTSARLPSISQQNLPHVNRAIQLVYKGNLPPELQDFFRMFFSPLLDSSSVNLHKLVINPDRKGIKIFIQHNISNLVYSPVFYLKKMERKDE